MKQSLTEWLLNTASIEQGCRKRKKRKQRYFMLLFVIDFFIYKNSLKNSANFDFWK